MSKRPETQQELCAWLRENSAGVYRPCAEAATQIETLSAQLALLETSLKQKTGQVWVCRVGHEIFRTTEWVIAKDWVESGQDVRVEGATDE